MEFGLEPRDVPGAAIVLGFAKPHERTHLVDVAPHRLCEAFELADQRVGLVVHQLRVVAQSHQQRMEQREPLTVVVQDSVAREVDERPRHRKRARHRGHMRHLAREQFAGPVADLPHDLVGRDVIDHQPAHHVAPAVEIVLGLQRNDPHGGSTGG